MAFLNKPIIVTGASSGIGRAVAILLGQEGAKIGLVDVVSPAKVEAEIRAAGGEATAYQCDVRSSEQVGEVIKSMVEKYGLLRGAANMAGVIGPGRRSENNSGSLIETSDEEWNRVLDINLGGVKNCLRAELQYSSPDGCSIVNASSVAAHIGSPWNSAYSASKAAVIALTKSVAQEVGRKGIRVNAIAPGITDTGMAQSLPNETRTLWANSNALGRMAAPIEIAHTVLFLLSDRSSFTTAAVYNIDAGRV